ncbi:NAD(P)-binding protein [Lojkania enalia]|uniref:NAD(P)-binding protein n=1 Tax=Lojkania enalia TaxID=147567 RepID=A0A9P4K3L6_9PLEO|nr:NAD(P)-binding protein [Didymosphaeria enalia]
MMEGDYEADYGITEPFPLYLYFEMDDQTKIRLLRINQIKPDEPTMRAVWAAYGNDSDPISAVRSDIWKIPKPPKGWVRVKVSAAGLNYHDIFTLRGLGMFELEFPLILGNEAAGMLEDGTEVIIYPVMGNPDFEGDSTLDPARHVLGELTQGSLAEYVIVPEGNIIKKPANMSFETASVLGIAWLTAYRMLFTRSGLQMDQKMLVQGSTGGVATALIQLGRAAGMEVWCTGRTEEKQSKATSLGAHRTFQPGEELPEKVAAVFDMSGAQTFKHSMESLAAGGTLVSCGLHSGGMTAEVDLMKLFTQGINIHGSYAGNKKEFEDLVEFVATHKLEPYISAVLPLERATDGLQMILNGTIQGKVVIKI